MPTELHDRIKSILEDYQLMSLATVNAEGLPWVRYVMGRGREGLSIRIATYLESRKVKHIRLNPEVHICCGVTNPGDENEYLQIQGRATLCTDETTRNAEWHEGLADYFTGPGDPNYGVIRVDPYRIEYMAPGSMKPQIWELLQGH